MSISKEDLQYLTYSKSFQEEATQNFPPLEKEILEEDYFVEFYTRRSIQSLNLKHIAAFYNSKKDNEDWTTVIFKSCSAANQTFEYALSYKEFAHQFYGALKKLNAIPKPIPQ